MKRTILSLQPKLYILDMKKFTVLTSTAVPFYKDNIDTDQIIPAQFLKVTTKEGLGEKLFWSWRQDSDFVLHNAAYKGAKILVVGENFGCGSSREHAPWALADYGFEVIIGISFADIFSNNALKNGLLPVSLQHEEVAYIIKKIEKNPSFHITIDLPQQKISLETGEAYSFPMDAFRKNCLLRGVDDLGYILGFEEKISEYEKKTLIGSLYQ